MLWYLLVYRPRSDKDREISLWAAMDRVTIMRLCPHLLQIQTIAGSKTLAHRIQPTEGCCSFKAPTQADNRTSLGTREDASLSKTHKKVSSRIYLTTMESLSTGLKAREFTKGTVMPNMPTNKPMTTKKNKPARIQLRPLRTDKVT